MSHWRLALASFDIFSVSTLERAFFQRALIYFIENGIYELGCE
jgi:hypothetical protein